jgi:hypothetical protein
MQILFLKNYLIPRSSTIYERVGFVDNFINGTHYTVQILSIYHYILYPRIENRIWQQSQILCSIEKICKKVHKIMNNDTQLC